MDKKRKEIVVKRMEYDRNRRSSLYRPRSDTAAKPLLNLTKEQRTEFFNSFDTAVVACEGIIWKKKKVIPNAGRVLTALKHAGKYVRFVSTEIMVKEKPFCKELAKAGFEDPKRTDIVHPIKNMVRHLNNFNTGQTIFSICSNEVNEKLRTLDNVRIISLPVLFDYDPIKLQRRIDTKEKVDAVIMDFNHRLTFAELAKAAYHLENNDRCVVIVASSAPLTTVGQKVETLGMGGFVNILRECTSQDPILLDVPGPELRDEIRTYFGIKDPERVLYIGNSMINDIHFGISSGYQTLFVANDASIAEEMYALPKKLKPDYTANTLEDLEALVDGMRYMRFSDVRFSQ